MTRTRPAAAVVLAALALALAACGEREQPAESANPASDRLTLALDYLPNVDHAGLYAAQGTGAFDDAHLDVKLQTPADPAAPLRLLAAGKVDLAISYEPEVLLARDKGADVVSIGALVQSPLTSVMSVGKDAITSARDLDGKTVGTAGIPYQDAYLKAILDAAGVDPGRVKKVNVGFNLVPAMLNGRVDATLGAFWNIEGVDLARRKKDPSILRLEKLGVPTYDELVIVARRRDARDRGAVLRRFLYALSRGALALRDDPNAGIDPLVKANPDLDRKLQDAQLKATLPAFFPDGPDKPYGWQDPGEWAAYARWMRDNGLLTQRRDQSGALTNEFLPGEGPTPGS